MFQGGGAAAATGHFEPFLPGLVVLLPLIGFLINGFLALKHARASADAVRAGGELDLDGPGGRPATHTLPTWVGPGAPSGKGWRSSQASLSSLEVLPALCG